MICSRSTHMESAFFTCGSRSSRFFGLRGFEFQVMLVVSAPGTLFTTMSSSFSRTLDGGERHLVDPVEVALQELGDHRVGVREVRERDRLGVRRRPVEALPGQEDGRALLLVLLDRVRAARDDRQVLLRVEGLEPLAVRADERLPDVLREDEELLELGEHVADRGVVVDDERVVVRRLRVLHVRERGRGDRRRPVRVLERGVDRPRGIGCRERRSVRPGSARLQVEGPVLAVRGRLPATPPSRPRSRARRRPARTGRAAGRS